MASIYLIRHGQASFGQSNYDDLSELGQQQARLVGAAFAPRVTRLDGVVTGSMQRHKQTANGFIEGFYNANKPKPEQGTLAQWEDHGWDEYDFEDILAAFGPESSSAAAINEHIARQANPKKAFEVLFNDAMNRWMSGQYDSDYSESWQAYQDRIHGALEAVVERTRNADSKPSQNVAVFTSGGVISVVAQALLGVPSEKMMHMNWTLMNCAVTKIVASKDRLFVATLNEHVHFEIADTQSFITYK